MFLEIISLIVLLLGSVYWYLKTYTWNYWKQFGIYQIPGSIPIEEIIMTKHMSDVKQEEYLKARNEKIFGSYLLFRPVLNINDPELIKQILVKDFDFFVDRTLEEVNKMTDSLSDQVWSRQITMMEGDAWKHARSTFSPIFTSGKMKAMKIFIDELSKKLVEAFDESIKKKGGEVDLKDVFGKFTMDTIATCAFGVEANSFASKTKQSPFVENASSLFMRGPLDAAKFFLLMAPGGRHLMNALGISVLKPSETMFFYEVVKETLRMRKEEGKNAQKRNDLIDLMLAAIKNESANTEEDEDEDQFDKDSKLSKEAIQQNKQSKDLDEFDIISTAFLILIAGYDTTSQALSYAGYELAKNPEAQRKLQEEIDAAFGSTDGDNLDYNTIQNLPYLDMVIHETLRLHPALGVLERVCTKDNFKVPGTNIVLKKQSMVHIPVYGIHTDEKFYPNPLKFDPERFSKENKAKRNPYLFMGFGQGPRSCLGMRFALLEAKIALASVIKEFEFQTCGKTVTEIHLDPKSVLSSNIGGLWVKAQRRN